MSKRILTWAGVIQCEKRDERAGSSTVMAASSWSSRTAASAVRGVALALAGVDRAAREHPHAAHEARLRGALHEQHLEGVVAAAQHDHRRRLARTVGVPRC